MIWTVLQVNVRRLLHSRVEIMLTFAVPIAFFSIFAIIFGGGLGSSTTPKINVVAVDEVASQESIELLQTLRDSPGLRFKRDSDEKLNRESAGELVRHGIVTMAIVLTESSGNATKELHADLLTDASNQVAGQIASALVARAMMIGRAASLEQQSRLLATSPQRSDASRGNASQANYEVTADDLANSDVANSDVASVDVASSDVSNNGLSNNAATNTSPVKIIDVMGDGKTNPVVSMYAAGIAVMFLLFGATGGGGALLEERENQTLDRLLSTRLSMDELLLGKWFYQTAVGVLQVCVMFLWGQLVFGVDLVNHLDGFLMMTVVTASAAAAFGLCLATICKTRGQLNGLSMIVVLTMSALGGSMVPRYVMSDGMRQAGMWTFNAWALDGYDKVFWRDLPVQSLWPELSVLMLSGATFLVVARLLAIRWETD